MPSAKDVFEYRRGFARLLEAELLANGLTAVRAADVETAELLLRDGMKPRAVVLDLMLPGADSEGFLATLGARTGNRMPTIVLTVKCSDGFTLSPRTWILKAPPGAFGMSTRAIFPFGMLIEAELWWTLPAGSVMISVIALPG